MNQWQNALTTRTSSEQFSQQAVALPDSFNIASAMVEQSGDVSDGGNEPSNSHSNYESQALFTTPVQQSSNTTALGADWALAPILGEDRGTIPNSVANRYRYVPGITVLLSTHSF